MRAVLVLCLLAGSAHAEHWYRGTYGTNRVVHLSATAVGLALYPATNFLEDRYAGECRWCSGPNALDAHVRDALRWNDTDSAGTLSDITGHVATPVAGLSLVLAGTMADPSWAAGIDDVVPILESTMVSQYATRAMKIGFARERPDASDNLSFPSGHTSFAFAIATSAGMIAHARGYRSEPYLWASGLTLAALTGYLRIAASRHYLTDVLGGATVGVSAGLTVPLLMQRHELAVVATTSGAAVAGHW